MNVKRIMLVTSTILSMIGYALIGGSSKVAPQIASANTSVDVKNAPANGSGSPLTTAPAHLSASRSDDENARNAEGNDEEDGGSKPAVAPPQASPAPVKAVAPKPVQKPAPQPSSKDGTYTGASVDAFYGYVQVQIRVQGGKMTAVDVLRYPSDRNQSIEINSYALPILRSEAVSVQSANIDLVSGATDTSMAFRQSLASALAQV